MDPSGQHHIPPIHLMLTVIRNIAAGGSSGTSMHPTGALQASAPLQSPWSLLTVCTKKVVEGDG